MCCSASRPAPGHREVGLVLQRQLELVATASVVADSGLVLAPSAPGRPGPDVLGGCGVLQDQRDEQASDLR